MGGKWLVLLKEIAPNIARVALIANPGTTPYAVFFALCGSGRAAVTY
jgi:hypothetical protein